MHDIINKVRLLLSPVFRILSGCYLYFKGDIVVLSARKQLYTYFLLYFNFSVTVITIQANFNARLQYSIGLTIQRTIGARIRDTINVTIQHTISVRIRHGPQNDPGPVIRGYRCGVPWHRRHHNSFHLAIKKVRVTNVFLILNVRICKTLTLWLEYSMLQQTRL